MQLDADTSLASLQFTESSMDGLSLEQVVQQIDRNMAGLSSSMEGCDGRVKHSTPLVSSNSDSCVRGDRGLGKGHGGLGGSGPGGVLELVGREVRPRFKSGIKPAHKVSVPVAKAKTKTKVRNYNNKDS